jgi:hypothetical protein
MTNFRLRDAQTVNGLWKIYVYIYIYIYIYIYVLPFQAVNGNGKVAFFLQAECRILFSLVNGNRRLLNQKRAHL